MLAETSLSQKMSHNFSYTDNIPEQPSELEQSDFEKQKEGSQTDQAFDKNYFSIRDFEPSLQIYAQEFTDLVYSGWVLQYQHARGVEAQPSNVLSVGVIGYAQAGKTALIEYLVSGKLSSSETRYANNRSVLQIYRSEEEGQEQGSCVEFLEFRKEREEVTITLGSNKRALQKLFESFTAKSSDKVIFVVKQFGENEVNIINQIIQFEQLECVLVVHNYHEVDLGLQQQRKILLVKERQLATEGSGLFEETNELSQVRIFHVFLSNFSNEGLNEPALKSMHNVIFSKRQPKRLLEQMRQFLTSELSLQYIKSELTDEELNERLVIDGSKIQLSLDGELALQEQAFDGLGRAII